MAIEAKFVLVYSFDKANKPLIEDIESFTKINSVDSAWPYWREFVQNLTVRMGFPALTIPVLRFKMEKINKVAKSKSPKSKSAKSEDSRKKVS